MLIGWGAASREAVDAQARARGLTVWRRGEATVAGPEQMRHASSAVWESWLLGRCVGEEADPARTLAASMIEGTGDHPRGAYLAAVATDDRITLVADHLGARCFVYTRLPGGAIAAEHLAELLPALPSRPVPDRASVQQWCEARRIAVGHTLYEGVGRISPGRAVDLTASGTREHEWWFPRYEKPVRAPRAELARTLGCETLAAVGRACENSSLPAVKLSGGLDSATVAAGVRAARGPDKVLAFAGVFPEHEAVDESALIGATAEFGELELHRTRFSARSVLVPALDYIAKWGVPPASPNIFVWRGLMGAVRESGADVLIDGEGGDEIFGLQPYLIGDMLRRGRLLSGWRLSGRLPPIASPFDLRVRWRALKIYGLRGALPVAVQDWNRARRPLADLTGNIVPDGDRPAVAAREDPWRFKRRAEPFWWTALAQEWLVNGELLDVSGHLRRDALDGGVDQRHPFCHDVGLMEAILRLPPEGAYDRGRDRALLRDAMVGRIAPAVLSRREKSFFTDLSLERMEGAEGGWLEKRLRRPDAQIRDYVDEQTLGRILDQRPDTHWLRAVRSNRLFNLGMIQCWLESLADEGSVERSIGELVAARE